MTIGSHDNRGNDGGERFVDRCRGRLGRALASALIASERRVILVDRDVASSSAPDTAGTRKRSAYFEQFRMALDPDDVARAVVFALDQPPHVQIAEITILPINRS